MNEVAEVGESAAPRRRGRYSGLDAPGPIAVAERRELLRPLDDELRRDRLIDALAQRWRKSLVLVEAPGGYGKSTAVAQAIRDNDEDPSGVDHYVRCRSTRDVTELPRLLFALLDVAGPQSDDPVDQAERVAAALASRAPVDVALHIDDLHVITELEPVTELLAHLVRSLPANAHLVLVGRSLPALPTARLLAADRAVTIGADTLAFTDDEAGELADRHGADHAAVDGAAGWPAMTRLALAVGGDAPVDFLVDEIVGRLGAEERAAIAAVSMAGGAGRETLAACDLDLDPVALVGRAPLLAETGEGVVAAHDLWADVIDRLVDGDEQRRLAAALGPWLCDQGRYDDAVATTAGAGLWRPARLAVLAALSQGDTRLTAALLDRWLRRFPADQLDEPELLFLRGMSARLAGGPGEGDEEIQAAFEGLMAAGRTEEAGPVAIEHGVRAWLRNDVDTVLGLMAEAERVGWNRHEPMRSMGLTGHATISELSGEFRQALDVYDNTDLDLAPRDFRELNARHESTLAFLVGDGERGVRAAQQLVTLADTPFNRLVRDLALWQAGDPEPVIDGWEDRRYPRRDNVRDDFLMAVFSAMVDVSLGLTPEVERVRSLVWDRSREHGFAALVEAAELVGSGEDESAARRLAGRLEELGLDDPLVVGELGRFMAYGYVLVPEARAVLDRIDYGPTLARRRDVARLLLDLREGQKAARGPVPRAGEVVTALPLPWAVELVARLFDRDPDGTMALAETVLELVGPPANRRLRALAAGPGDGPASRGASALLGALPAPPGTTTTVTVCGPLTVRHGDGSPEAPNRKRVRQLLGLLVLRPRPTRDELMVALWPDMDAARARNNLSITLTHLRQTLEPDLRPGEAAFHLRREGERVWLHDSSFLDVDLSRFRRRLETGRQRERAGDPEGAAAAYREVADGWTAPALVDLRAEDDLAAELAELDERLAEATVRAAEWAVSEGAYDDAVDLARRLLRHDPFNERAHAVAIGGCLGRGDLGATRAAIEACHRALDELGVSAPSAIRMLERRYAARARPGGPHIRAVG